MHSPFTSRALVLQSLLAGECYGLEILERLKRQIKTKKSKAKEIRFHQGSIYPVLWVMKKERLLASRPGKTKDAPKRGGRPRIYFKLTARGRSVALETRAIALSFYKNKSQNKSQSKKSKKSR
jgi:PadR family transcriptional regulator, regulatory protein PadR